jgi:hypothetical protein
MSREKVLLEFDKQYFIVRLYEDVLKMDLKGTTRNNIIEALENKPILRETIGSILGMFAPLHIRLSDIDSVSMDEKGNAKLILPRHRDITIPLQRDEAKKLINRLNQLIPQEKRRALLRAMKQEAIQKAAEEQLEVEHAAGEFPIFQSPSVEAPEVSEDIAAAEEKEEQKKED